MLTTCLLALAGLVTAVTDPAAAELPAGLWQAEILGPGGPVRFGLELQRKQDITGDMDLGDPKRAWDAWFVNGAERIPVPGVVVQPGGVRLEVNHYDARISSSRLGTETSPVLDGSWTKRNGLDDFTRMPFRATAPGAAEPLERGDPSDLVGRWRVDFADDEQPAVAVFEAAGDELRGTFLTTLGDYRYLAGRRTAEGLELSCFDGAHAFRFEARLLEDGSLEGDFWSRDSYHDTWTAVRDETAMLPDGFQLTRWTGQVGLEELVYPDLTRAPRRLSDDSLGGKARIIQLFGSWCPNCHDASDLLVDLFREYGPQGLSIVGLAFEMTGDFNRDAQQVRRYAELHEVPYPLLLAGPSDKERASRVFPLIDEVRAFPTTIFLHHDGRVRAVYQGFSGPATGMDHDVLRATFASLIEELLLDGEAAANAAMPPAPPAEPVDEHAGHDHR